MQRVIIHGVPFNHSMSPRALAKACKLVEDSRVATKGWAAELRAAIISGDQHGRANAVHELLYNPAAVLTAAIEANTKLREAKRSSLEACLGIAGQLDFSQPLPEKVRVWSKRKKSGANGQALKYRVFHDHGILHRTAQHAILRVLGEFYKPKHFQFTHLGVQAALKRAKGLITEGYKHAARLDIVDFFGSFQGDALVKELPLPKGVVEHAVIGRQMEVWMDQGKSLAFQGMTNFPPPYDDLLLQARRGIPLGSACSPMVGMVCVSHLALNFMQDVEVLNYADDFQLLAKSRKSLKEAIGKLTEAVKGLPGGYFKLAMKSESSVENGIEFLGHSLRLVDGELKTKPSSANQLSIFAKLSPLEDRLSQMLFLPGNCNPKKAAKVLAEQYAVLNGWLSVFGECDEIEQWRASVMASIEHSMELLDMTDEQLTKSIEPWMGYKSVGSGLTG